METPVAVSSNVEWFPHRVDAAMDQMLFVHLNRDDHRRLTFLSDDFMGEAGPRQVVRIKDVPDHTGRLGEGQCHFIFHSAFCCSTLLARAFDIEGVVMTLKEPTALMELAETALATGDVNRVRSTLAAVLGLMARPFTPGEAVLIKPTNVTNPLIDQMLSLRPEAKAILLYSPLPNFLRSLAKKGLWGRLWARRAFRSVSRMSFFDAGYSEAERWEHTDLQVAALLWLQQQAQFGKIVRSQPKGRVATLDSETFLKNPKRALAAASSLFDLSIAPEIIAKIADGPIFNSNSKHHDQAFDAARRAKEHAQAEAAHGEEIGMVVQWAKSVAAHVGAPMILDMPLVG